MTPEEMIPGFVLRPAWRLDDPQIEADVLAFWKRLNILPADVKPEERVKELLVVAYKDGEVAGVHSAAIDYLAQVKTRLAMVRTAVDPVHRRSHLAIALTIRGRALVGQWSRDNPDARVGGMGAIIESRELAERGRQPFWPQTRFILAGFLPDGRQLRISWFEDYLLDVY